MILVYPLNMLKSCLTCEVFMNEIKKIYECNLVDDSEIETIRFSVGLSPEHIIKVLKWLFIEQDIRYWNYSGRGMTWGIIPSP